MSDSKISNLTAATTPLAGTEVLPIVQGGTTKKVSIASLFTSPAITGTYSVTGRSANGAGLLTGTHARFGGTVSDYFGATVYGLFVQYTISPPSGGYDAMPANFNSIINRPTGGGLGTAAQLNVVGSALGGTGTANNAATLRIDGAMSGATNNYALLVTSGNTLLGGNTSVTGVLSATATIATGGYTVATLPVGTVGQRAYVTDAVAPVYNTALTGGGTVTVPVFRNSTMWVSA